MKQYVLPYIKEHRLTEVARVLVNAAEALYGAGHGKEKLEYCIQQINEKYHLHVDPEKVTNAIQAAWQELDIAQKSVKTAE